MTDLEEFWAAPPSLLWPHGTLSSPAGRSTPLSCHLEPQGSSCAPQICRLGASCPPFLHPAAVCVSPTANADFNPAYQSLLVKLPHHFFFLAALGLRCCARAFSSCGERVLLFVAVRGLLIAVASLAAEHGL